MLGHVYYGYTFCLLMLVDQSVIKLAFLANFVTPELSRPYHAVKAPSGDQVIILGAKDWQIKNNT